MDQQSQNPNLEDTLRQMILGNVRIGHAQEDTDAASRPNNPLGNRHQSSFRGGRQGYAPRQQQGIHGGNQGQSTDTVAQNTNSPGNRHQWNSRGGRQGYVVGQQNGIQQPNERGTFRQVNSIHAPAVHGNQPYNVQHLNQAQQTSWSGHQNFQPSSPRGRGRLNYVTHQGFFRGHHHGGTTNASSANVSNSQYDSNARNQPAPGAKLWSSSNPQAEHSRPSAPHGHPQVAHAIPDPSRFRPDQRWDYLEEIANRVIPEIGITSEEFESKMAFRLHLEAAFQAVQAEGGTVVQNPMTVQTFGSLRSGFATKGSDMDLVIVDDTGSDGSAHISMRQDGLPRRLEKYLLDRGIGARLLTRARVPIIKVCESPPSDLLQALKDARAKWDELPEEEKYDESGNRKPLENRDQTKDDASTSPSHSNDQPMQELTSGIAKTNLSETPHLNNILEGDKALLAENGSQPEPKATTSTNHSQKRWLREKKQGPLDFPKDGVGIQCDINFFNPLGLHNTQMLYCYSLCDRRVQPMIMFIKAWAKKRKINSPYSGTLSSYGYVLMVLHYLVNVAKPPVLPNLQTEANKMNLPVKTVEGWEVHFWNDDAAIREAAMMGRLSRNNEPLGALLTGFFQYYATSLSGWGFIWMKSVLSLRTPGGILTKEEKGWTGAKTETVDTKEIRHRYLFAVEDPFELTHNVARTVTHNGVVAIRDEFRRAWRILGAVWKDRVPNDGNLMDDLVEQLADDA
ncbi:hypothetical protein K461DRAFT_278122 [Myriangium duriaei CBS 260.36]|uniref:polynucleotide adenylyltransferase n=1 Tax=Myriangium duriaei CBS 260.36 TaxID=1168546 RepID=A0A9P4J4X8_9PEZI|nr:hypothetical protein K461DRAFT_278122 [Myriangium duriaei CBS 260.36]